MKTLYLIQISLKFALKGPIDNKPMLVQVMAWRRIGARPLSESMLIPFTDAFAALGGMKLMETKPWQMSLSVM